MKSVTKTQKPRLVLAGQLIRDILDQGTPSEKIRLGGNVGAAVRALATLGLANSHVGLWSYHGVPLPEQELLYAFDTRGIRTLLAPPDTCYFTTESGEPRFLKRDFESRIIEHSLPISYRQASLLVVSSLDPQSTKRALVPYEGRLVVNFSPWWDAVSFFELAQSAFTIVLNRQEAHVLTGSSTAEGVRRVMDDLGCRPEYLLVTKDAEGAECFTGERSIEVVAPIVRSRWKYGAGYILSTLFSYSVLNGVPLRDSIQLAVYASSYAVAQDEQQLALLRESLVPTFPATDRFHAKER